MALTADERILIQYVIEGDRERELEVAERILKRASETKADGAIAKYLLEKMTSKRGSIFNIPPNLSNILSVEFPDDKDFSFQKDRYLLSDREKPVAERIERMYNVAQQLKEHNINYYNATLLTGDSGVGKTEFAKYIAYRMKLPFVYLNFTSTLDSLMGKTGKNIELAFNFIKQHPCVFMIDEIDAIGEMRKDSGSAGQENGRIVTTLFLCMDKLTNDNIVLAATNRTDILDRALLRRFRETHIVAALTADERERYIVNYLKATGFIDTTQAERLYREARELARSPYVPRELESELVRRIADSLMEGKPLSLVDEVAKPQRNQL